jgi:hypothetical protein
VAPLLVFILLTLAGSGQPAQAATAAARAARIGFWESYAWLVAIVVICILEAVLIGILFLEWRRRHRAERSLAERLAFEELLTEVHADLVSIQTDDIDAQVVRALARVSESLGVDKGTLMDYERRGAAGYHQLRWARRPDIPIPPADVAVHYPWTLARMLAGKVNRFPASTSCRRRRRWIAAASSRSGPSRTSPCR